MTTNSPAAISVSELLSTTIRSLTEHYPVTMPLLAAEGLDLCCGGGHKLGEALELHNIDAALFVPRLLSAIASGENGG